MTGSIEKRGKNSYRLVVFKGYDLDGRPIRHQKKKKKNTLQEKIRSTNRTCKISNRSRKWTNSRWKYPNICAICGNMDKRLCIKRTSTINLL